MYECTRVGHMRLNISYPLIRIQTGVHYNGTTDNPRARAMYVMIYSSCSAPVVFLANDTYNIVIV